MTYLLDSNVLISAKNLHYGFDFCPAFWEWLDVKNKEGKVFSIERVADEIIPTEDKLSKWSKRKGEDFFLRPDEKILPALKKVAEWIHSKNYNQPAISTFLQSADYYLISHAYAHSFTVISHEVPAGGAKKIKIPDVCIGLDIKFKTPFQMLRTEKARFILKNI